MAIMSDVIWFFAKVASYSIVWVVVLVIVLVVVLIVVLVALSTVVVVAICIVVVFLAVLGVIVAVASATTVVVPVILYVTFFGNLQIVQEWHLHVSSEKSTLVVGVCIICLFLLLCDVLNRASITASNLANRSAI